jgi:hypothetical protein
VPFADISRNIRPWLLAVTAARAVLLLGSIVFLANFYLTACRILNVSRPAYFNPPAAAEAPTS